MFGNESLNLPNFPKKINLFNIYYVGKSHEQIKTLAEQ